MENIIKKAIEGGYDPLDIWSHEQMDNMYRTLICDSLFWQALGKACGWTEIEGAPSADGRTIGGKHKGEIDIGDDQRLWQELWLYHALRFHEINLTESWNKAVEYLQEVTK